MLTIFSPGALKKKQRECPRACSNDCITVSVQTGANKLTKEERACNYHLKAIAVLDKPQWSTHNHIWKVSIYNVMNMVNLL